MEGEQLRECQYPHDFTCRPVAETASALLLGACFKVSLRLPDPNTMPMPVTIVHRPQCYAYDKPAQEETYYSTRLHCLLARCNMLAVSRRLAAASDRFRWHVVEYVPGESLRVCLYIYWAELVMRPQAMLSEISRLGRAAEFVVPFTRLGVTLDISMIRNLLEPRRSHADRQGQQLLSTIERNHRGILPAVAAFIDTGDVDAYTAAARHQHPFAVPSVQSLQEIIDVSQYIRVQLKPYQIAAAAWALDREKTGCVADVSQLRPQSDNVAPYGISRFSHTYEMWSTWTVLDSSYSGDLSTRGGFMLHEMGMGKTLQMLALIIAADYKSELSPAEEGADTPLPLPPPPAPLNRQALDLGLGEEATAESESEFDSDHKQAVCSSSTPTMPRTPGGTLIIVPLTLMNQWVDEIHANIVNGAKLLRPVLYHGPSRHAMQLDKSPVVITTYETVTADTRHYQNESKLDAVRAIIEWQCPGVPYVKAVKQARDPQPNDILTRRGIYLHILGFEKNVYYVMNVHSNDILRNKLLKPVKPNDSSTYRNAFRCSVNELRGATLVGELTLCTQKHPSGLTPECATCGYDARKDIYHFALSKYLQTPLEHVVWQRIVLDESHKLQSTNTAVFRAVMRLLTLRKWCMTGTPMPKSVENLNGQLSFLEVGTAFQRVNSATELWLADIMVRHSKRECLSGLTVLPPVTHRDIMVTLSDDDRVAYTRLQNDTRERFGARTENDRMFVPQMFQLLARERRACTVVMTARPTKRRRVAPAATPAAPELPPVPEHALNAADDCPVCFEPIPHAVMLPCRHCFCHECLLALLEAGEHKCSLCQVALTGPQVLDAQRTCRLVGDALAAVPVAAPAAAAAPVAAEATTDADTIPTAYEKFTVLLELVTSEPRRPTLVYTQFDDVVHTLQTLLQEEGITVFTLTGSMSRAARAASLSGFREHNDAVLILSLRTAAVGLNLTHASRVVFMDPPMNSGLEAQACGRVHRLGQRNPVDIVHLIARGTVEERIRAFRDMDTSNHTGAEVQVGRVRVVMAENQHRVWRERQLESLMG